MTTPGPRAIAIIVLAILLKEAAYTVLRFIPPALFIIALAYIAANV